MYLKLSFFFLNFSDYVLIVLKETREMLENKIKPFLQSGVTPEWAENPRDTEILKGFLVFFQGLILSGAHN